MENRSWGIESGWTCSGGSSTTKDIWTETCGDGADATVKDGAAIVVKWKWYNLNWWILVNVAIYLLLSKIQFKNKHA